MDVSEQGKIRYQPTNSVMIILYVYTWNNTYIFYNCCVDGYSTPFYLTTVTQLDAQIEER
jgi:hypothetical protein